MARDTTTKKKDDATPLEQASALATTTSASMIPAPDLDELAGLFGEEEAPAIANDGLSEIDPEEDIKIALKVWNMRGLDENRRQREKDVFFDTLTEKTSKSIDCVLLDMSKTNLWYAWNEEAEKNDVYCRSDDRITGTKADGTKRQCDGCPDAQWQTGDDGKRSRNCSIVYTFAALDLETHMLAIFRFKRTAVEPMKVHLNRHHLGRRIVKGKRGNYPLFAFRVRISLEMDESGNFARPVFEKLGTVDRATFEECVESARYYREHLLARAHKLADEKDVGGDAGGAGAGSTDFPGDGADGAIPTDGEQTFEND